MTMGRPYHYEEFEDFEEAVLGAIETLRGDKIPITILGICVEMNMLRKTFTRYAERGEEWKELHEHLKEISENDMNTKGLMGGVDKTMAIFNLKVNHGWVEKQHIELDTRTRVIRNDGPKTDE